MIRYILTVLLIVLVIFLASCKTPVQDIVDPTPDDITGTQTENTDNDPTNPYNSEDLREFIKQQYDKAKEAYFWFEIDSLPPEDKEVDFNSIKEINGLYYYKVGHETINSLGELEAYLKTIFSDEITARLLEEGREHYIDIDGELWAVDANRGTDISVGDAIFSIKEKSDNRIVYIANVEELDLETGETVGINTHEYIYEKTDNGWRWTQFSIYE